MAQVSETLRDQLLSKADELRRKELCRLAGINRVTLWNILQSGCASPTTLRKIQRAFPDLAPLIT